LSYIFGIDDFTKDWCENRILHLSEKREILHQVKEQMLSYLSFFNCVTNYI